VALTCLCAIIGRFSRVFDSCLRAQTDSESGSRDRRSGAGGSLYSRGSRRYLRAGAERPPVAESEPVGTALCSLAALVPGRPVGASLRQRSGQHPVLGSHGVRVSRHGTSARCFAPARSRSTCNNGLTNAGAGCCFPTWVRTCSRS
jgi:hypothetical protein